MLEGFANYGYVGFFAAIIATGFGLPMPEELPILGAGVMVGHDAGLAPDGRAPLRWYIMLPVIIAAVVVGDGLLYGVGRVWGPKLLDKEWVKRRVLSPEKRAIIEKNFQDRGIMILLTARLTPGIRTPIFLMAGVLRVSFTRFLIADGLYAIPGVFVMFWLAYFLTDQVLDIFHKIEQYRQLVVVGILSAIGGIVLYRLFVNRRVATGSSNEVPTIAKPVEVVTEAMEHAVEAAVNVVTHRSHHDESPPPAETHSQPHSDAKSDLKSDPTSDPTSDAKPPNAELNGPCSPPRQTARKPLTVTDCNDKSLIENHRSDRFSECPHGSSRLQ